MKDPIVHDVIIKRIREMNPEQGLKKIKGLI